MFKNKCSISLWAVITLVVTILVCGNLLVNAFEDATQRRDEVMLSVLTD